MTGSVGLALIVANLAWLIYRGLRGRWRWAAIIGSSGFQAFTWLIVSIYLLLPPLIAWREGAISPYLLGLAELDWTHSFGIGGLLTGTDPGVNRFRMAGLPAYGVPDRDPPIVRAAGWPRCVPRSTPR